MACCSQWTAIMTGEDGASAITSAPEMLNQASQPTTNHRTRWLRRMATRSLCEVGIWDGRSV
ncbi:hypothetical protein QC762_0036080 [Podospora pseudocomata]|uniref:Uncharacterized protein n=1 Tax=Podospora pseudocomata TaxID=2093779 RepID=A0ABR0GLD3_9PEZI|nr:hypothetical protein QC762_0036080 [Podospora pseudocomata]